MMKKIVIAGAAALLVFLWSCTSQPDLPSGGLSFGGSGSPQTDGNAEADSWNLEDARKAAAGMYKGLMPYPNSGGLETVVRLRKDGSYILRSRIIGSLEDTLDLRGNFDINRKGIITLDKTAVNTISPLYALSLNPAAITQLDAKGNPVSGDTAGRYILKKFPAEITETYWKLVSLYGQPVIWTGDTKREPHILLRLEGYKAFGHSGTNSFSGSYTVKDSGGISFSPMRSTMMASPNMKIEMDFYKALGEANSYTVDEEIFTIGVKGREPSAVFEAVYLK
ncbi:MAG: META domain-containing protein [Spirochaetales bacterium]|nr:META domain-containing protein [Spirochaetales bacterium]